MRLLARQHLFTLLVGFLFLNPHLVLAAESQANDWEDPNMIGRNKEAAKATALPFADVEAALSDGQHDAARRSADELAELATADNGDFIVALARTARGRIALADGDTDAAAACLYRGCTGAADCR